MPFNLLIFPLIGGYCFLILSRFTKYHHQRIDRQKLLFNSTITGVFLLITAAIVTGIITHYFPNVSLKIKSIFPLDLPYLGTTFLAFIFGITMALFSNIFKNETKAIISAIDNFGNELELLTKASWEHGILLNISLKSGKSYVGWVTTLQKPSKSTYITLLPAFSGYRSSDTKELTFTTQYLDLYAEFIKTGKYQSLNDMNFQIVINTDEVISASIFDIEVYELFNSDKRKS